MSDMFAYEPILAIASSIENVGAMKRTVAGLNLAKVLKLLAGKFGALRHNNYITKRVTVNTKRYLSPSMASNRHFRFSVIALYFQKNSSDLID